MEILITVAIIAVAAVAVVPALRLVPDKERMDSAESLLLTFDSAVVAFRKKVGTNPGRLSHLATQITASDSSACVGYTGTEVNRWPGTPPAGGPYIKEVLPRDSFALGPVGMIGDKLLREPASAGGPGRFHFLSFFVTKVQEADAKELNDRIDGSADLDPAATSNLTGNVQWESPDAQGFVTLKYRMIIPKPQC